jgi:hypothetical protein
MRARFFCDSCGAAVWAKADTCPACGKTFAAVRCPQCGYEGKPSDFVRGCVVCGYMAPEGGRGKPRSQARPRRELPLSPGVARIAAVALLLLLCLFFILIIRR